MKNIQNALRLARRQLLGWGLIQAANIGTFKWAQAQEGHMSLYVGFPVGGSGDLFARILAEGLREETGRTVVVENKPGGGGITVASQFLRAPKDGSHLMLATGSTAVAAPISRAKAPYHPAEDFQWIALLSNAPFVIAVNPALNVNNLRELVNYCKARNGEINYGHAGRGTTVHLAGELFKDKAGIEVSDVPYAGSAPAIHDTIAGNVQFIIETSGTLMPYHKSGKLRIISVMSESREKISPNIPTAREEGLDLVAGTYNLLAAPWGTPVVSIEKISKAVSKMMAKPSTIEKLSKLGITPISQSSPEQARAFLNIELERWGAVVKKLGISL